MREESNTCDGGKIDPHQQSEVGADVIDGVVRRTLAGSVLDRHRRCVLLLDELPR